MKKALTDLVAWSTDEARKMGLGELIERDEVTRIRHGLGGSHTVVTYPPLDALCPLKPGEITSVVKPAKGLNLYAHVPFCEHMCPFCHYAKTYSPIANESSLMAPYLDALHAEMRGWLSLLQGSTVSSLYVGGGTPTAVPTSDLLALVELLLAIPQEPGFKACVETSPLTTVAAEGRDRLLKLSAMGVNRFSIGVQTFDDKLLRRTRGHGTIEARAAVATLADLGVEFNIDMMQDLPHQTDDILIADLNRIDEFRPNQVTWYLLRVHCESPWFRMYMRGDLELASPVESARRRLLIQEGMRRLGYTRRPGGRFVLSPSVNDHFKMVRASNEPDLLGIGVSAYSHGWGYFFRNIFDSQMKAGVRGYIERVRQGNLAVEAGFRLTDVEQVAGRVVAGIRSGLRLPDPDPAVEEYLTDCLTTLRALHRTGLVTIDAENVWSITEKGAIFEEEICSLFYTDFVKRALLDKSGDLMGGRLQKGDDALVRLRTSAGARS